MYNLILRAHAIGRNSKNEIFVKNCYSLLVSVNRAVGRSQNLKGGGRSNLVGIICLSLVWIRLTDLPKSGGTTAAPPAPTALINTGVWNVNGFSILFSQLSHHSRPCHNFTASLYTIQRKYMTAVSISCQWLLNSRTSHSNEYRADLISSRYV